MFTRRPAVPSRRRTVPRRVNINSFSDHTRIHARSNTNQAKEDEEKKSAHLLSTLILLFFQCF